MKRKLKSQRGASITFALLLFLVCAVISSVVIVAGTTAAGRMSDLAKMDQRYYAVTSAAGLLRDIIEDQTITVKKSTVTIKTYSSNPETGEITEASEPGDPEVILEVYKGEYEDENKVKVLDPTQELLTEVAACLENGTSLTKNAQLLLKVNGTGKDDLFTVTAEVAMDNATGNLKLTVYNGAYGNTGEKYTLNLYFERHNDPPFSETSIEPIEPPTKGDRQEKQTSSKITKMFWKLDKIGRL